MQSEHVADSWVCSSAR